jgi:Na+-transporting methylmalonyl-CoA/oxaloacetate decarboxylase gamma subunit
MNRKAKTRKATARGGNLLLILGVAFVVLILLLRMITFVAHVRGR